MKKTALFLVFVFFAFCSNAQVGQQEIGKIYGQQAHEFSGGSINLNYDGDIIAVGGVDDNYYMDNINDDDFPPMPARVFKYIDCEWVQLGQDILPTYAGKNAYSRVSLNAKGDILSVSNRNGSNGSDKHTAVYKYNESDDQWEQIGGAITSIYAKLDSIGHTMVVWNEKVKVFRYDESGDAWNQVGSTIDINGHPDINLQGDIVSVSTTSSIKVFKNNGDVWEQLGNDIEEQLFVSDLNSVGDAIVMGQCLGVDDDYDISQIVIYKYSDESNEWSQYGNRIVDTNKVGLGNVVCINGKGNMITSSTYDRKYNITKFKIDSNEWKLIGDTIYLAEINKALSMNNSGDIMSYGIDHDNSATGYAFIYGTSIYLKNVSLCMVTVDTTTSMNKVIWNRDENDALVDYYKIYREEDSTFVLLDSVDADDMTEYLDTTAEPNVKSWIYKLSAVDVCGIESQLSSAHKTIHLEVEESDDDEFTLAWDDYEGTEYSSVSVYRKVDDNDWELLETLDSDTYSYTDTPPSGDILYVVIINVENTCSPSTRDANIIQLRSNIVSRTSHTGIKYLKNNNIKIYPNPSKGQFTVQGQDIIRVEINSVNGRKIQDIQSYGNIFNIDIAKEAKGLYFVKVTSKEDVVLQKIILK